ncbi:hypothetical protein FRC12_013180 [Ceratobasidium sp. 428]|nr:hypothetical protein FRC12_013180 [Ceratobasidium sp. 428]
MPKSEVYLTSAYTEIQAALASYMIGIKVIDHTTSEGSTSPFTIEQCKAWLMALNEAARSEHVTYLNWLIVHNRNINRYGLYGAKLDWTATIGARRYLPRPSSRYEDQLSKTSTGGGKRRSTRTAPHPYRNTLLRGDICNKAVQFFNNGVLVGHSSSSSGTAASEAVTIIESTMGIREVMKCLVEHGCQDITDELNSSSSSHDPIAWGGLGNVYLVELQDGTKAAVKCLSNLRHLDVSDESSKTLKRTAREIYAWSKCDHPGVLPLLGIGLFRGQVAMVSEWMTNGTLHSYLRKRLPFDQIQLCVRAAEALEYMHTQGIVHGDIKTANILMSDNNTPLFVDFGNAIVMHEPSVAFTTTTSLGITLRYTPPEILTGDTRYTREADVYTFGMMVFEIVTGHIPFPSTPSIAITYAITVKKLIPERPDLSSVIQDKALGDEFWSLLTRCWAYKPNERPSASELRKQLTLIWKRLDAEHTS